MDPFKQYLNILKEDVAWHKFVDDGQKWPPNVRDLRGELLTDSRRVPSWVTTGPYPPIDPRAEPLLEELQNTFKSHAGSLEDVAFDQQLQGMFGTLLSDCARLRNVISSDSLCGSANPKESFLIVMICNAMSSVTADFSIDENVLVALPRYRGGGLNVPTKYMSNGIQVPLLMSVFAEIPDDNSNADGSDVMATDADTEEADSDAESHNPDAEQGEDEPREPSEPPRPDSVASPMSMSTFLSLCEKPVLIEESASDSESPYDPQSPAELNAHILVYPPSRRLPKRCSLPFLCAAEEDDLPLVMMAILYQRYVWKISEPVVGVGFSKYHTSIYFYIGWLDGDIHKEGSLPRVHLGSLGRDGSLDLASLDGAFALCRAVLALQGLAEQMYSASRATATQIAEEIRDDSVSMWRLDTVGCVNVVESNPDQHDRIAAWAQGLTYKTSAEMADTMGPKATRSTRRKAKAAAPEKSTSSASEGSSRSAYSKDANLPVISIPQEEKDKQDEQSQASNSLYNPMSCSTFAGEAAKKGNGGLVYNYLFNRRVVLSSTCSNAKMLNLCESFTGDVWPFIWSSLGDVPRVDRSLEPFRRELFEQAQEQYARKAPRDVPKEILPLLESSLSLILAATRRAQRKARSVIPPSESVWRHDFDALIFDFFTNALNGTISLHARSQDTTGVTDPTKALQLPEDDRLIPSTERTISLPRATPLKSSFAPKVYSHIAEGVPKDEGPYGERLMKWASGDGQRFRAAYGQEIKDHMIVQSQAAAWVTRGDGPSNAPYRGKCDALGTLSVDLPVRRELLESVQLVVTSQPKEPYVVDKYESKHIQTETAVLADTQRQTQDSIDNSFLTANPTPPPGNMPPFHDESPETRDYAIASSSFCDTDLLYENAEEYLESNLKVISERYETLTAGQRKNARIKNPVSILELPVLFMEYKKQDTDIAKGTNQHRMYCTAGATNLEVMGLEEIPVFSGLTDGPRVTLATAWSSHDIIEIFERHTRTIDISTALGAFRFASILARLAIIHCRDLEKRFGKVSKDLLRKLEAREFDNPDSKLQWKQPPPPRPKSPKSGEAGTRSARVPEPVQ
ncbi:hypothetical protein SCP_1403880 [Sparassis crispa]|uniref:Uncharacterized protein n=1 Tax=Sparassis crispa TaxID=139825 RepID=A0A401H3Q5_9APHY|nr:hypothetical protein SCP_1403880 [Sparassis crispa]GBE88980.1 hypothetical protein SCP_1403880 [Sparassis crispa]